jgi:hypothetical protein
LGYNQKVDRQDILNRQSNARAELHAATQGLSGAEIDSLPVAGTWTIRDILAHVSGWAAWDLAAIRAMLADEQPDWAAIQAVDTFNARLVAERRGWSVQQILAEMGQAQANLQDLLASLSDEDLFRAGPFRGPYWDNLAGWLQVGWEHEEEHAAQIRAWRAERRKALREGG